MFISPTQCNCFHFVTESLLNIHEDVRRDHWIPVAFMPIYDAEKSKRPTKGYECDSARAMRLYHDGWRNIFKNWKEKTQNNRVVSIGNGSRHQVRSFLGGTLGDQQVHIMHMFHIIFLIAYCGIFFVVFHISVINAYITYNLSVALVRSMTSSLARDRVHAIVVMQKGVIFYRIMMLN